MAYREPGQRDESYDDNVEQLISFLNDCLYYHGVNGLIDYYEELRADL